MPSLKGLEGALFAHAQRTRLNPAIGYGGALLAVGLATLLRWALQGQVMEGLPFITYFPAIVIAAFYGGFGPGMLTTVLSTVTAWYLFVPPTFSFRLDEPQAAALALFIFLACIILALISMLHSAVARALTEEMRALTQEKSAQFLAAIVASSDDAIVSKDLNGIITSWNTGAERLFGYTSSEAIGRPVTMLIPADRQNEEPAILQRIRNGEHVDHYETVRRCKDGSLVDVSLTVSPIRTSEGIIGASKIVRDISERKKAHEQQQFLIRELNHRSQNLFAVIQSIASRTFVEGRPGAEATKVFNARLAALANAHRMLAEAAWKGAMLSDILKEELAGFSKSLNVSGCDIIVNTPAAQQLSLIVHELATNSVKYGALSSVDGRVSVEGKINATNGEPTFSFMWKERGGPSVATPSRKGFGSVILLDAARQFGKNVAIDYDPDGLTYELELVLSQIEGSRKEGSGIAGPSAP